MTRSVRSVFRRHAFALLPTPPATFTNDLITSGITPVPYSPTAHDTAWSLLADYRDGTPPLSTKTYATEQVRSHLAAAYARAQGNRFSADRERMLSALLMPILSDHGKGTLIDIEEFIAIAERRLALPRQFQRGHLLESLKLLERDGLIAFQGESVVIGDIPQPKELTKDAERLVDGLVSRSTVRFRHTGLETQRSLLEQLILTALALDGLHLAHTLIRHQVFTSRRLEKTIEEAARRIRLPQRYVNISIAALTDLITVPDPEEERILTNIAAVVFGTALLLSDPLLANKLASPFGQGAYVDTSVLLPWLADGHPLQEGYDSVLRSFRGSGVRVLGGYVREILHHRRIAFETCEEGGFGDPEVLKRYASFFELHNINAFLGGYAGSLERGRSERFHEYMERVAPFEQEGDIRRALEARGVVVENYQQKNHGLVGELRAALKERRRFREDILLMHDAAQMEVLLGIRDNEVRPYFITADRALIAAAADTSCREALPHVLLPEQIALLAQMADRETAGLQVFSRTLWTVGETMSDKVKRYYTNRVLQEYEEGLITEIDTIMNTLLREIRAEGINLDEEYRRERGADAHQVAVFKRLDRFEPRFYENMADALRRARERGRG